jgi:hypothetical protein
VRGAAPGLADRTATLFLNVAPAYLLALNPNELTIGQGASGTTTVTITRTDFTGAVTLTLEGAPPGVTGVFNPTPAPGTSSQLTLSVGAAVAPDTYILTVRGAAPGLADRTATLFLNVSAAPAIALAPTSVTLSATAGGANPAAQTVSVSNSGGGTLSGLTASVAYTAGQPSEWLTATLSASTAPSTLTLTATTGSLAAGSYTASVAVAAPVAVNSPQTVTVTFTLSAGPQISLSSSNLTFNVTQGGPDPSFQTIGISNSGTGTLSGLNIGTITYGPGASGWLRAPQLNLTTASASTSLLVQTQPLDLIRPGTYTATIPVQSAVAGNSPQNLYVTLNVAAGEQCSTVAAPPISVGQTLSGTLSVSDCTLPTGAHADVYLLSLATETDVQIDLTTTAFTSRLRLRDAATGVIVEQGYTGFQNARLTRRLGGGSYIIEASANSPSGAGAYQLGVTTAALPIPFDGNWRGTASDGNTIAYIVQLNRVIFFFADLGRIEDGPDYCYLAYGSSASSEIVANSFEINWSAGTFRTTVSGTVSSTSAASGNIGAIILDSHPCGSRTWLGQLTARTWTGERFTIP